MFKDPGSQQWFIFWDVRSIQGPRRNCFYKNKNKNKINRQRKHALTHTW